jgi:hypothetical protein
MGKVTFVLGVKMNEVFSGGKREGGEAIPKERTYAKAQRHGSLSF